MTKQNITHLSRLRRSRGLSIDALARQMRFPAESLERMESGRYPMPRMIQAPDASLSIGKRIQVALETHMPSTQLLER
jgi:hypothetical protein